MLKDREVRRGVVVGRIVKLKVSGGIGVGGGGDRGGG